MDRLPASEKHFHDDLWQTMGQLSSRSRQIVTDGYVEYNAREDLTS